LLDLFFQTKEHNEDERSLSTETGEGGEEVGGDVTDDTLFMVDDNVHKVIVRKGTAESDESILNRRIKLENILNPNSLPET
jgi:hypothetical protein